MKKIFSSIRDWFKILGLALLLALFFKSCFFDVYTIPSTSMVSVLQPGDVVLVNKLSYGPKITRSILSIPFMHKNIPYTNGVKCFSDAINLPYFRFPGYEEINRNDLLVFHYPMDDLFPVDHRSFYIKRCIGLPGEEVEIIEDEVYINDTLLTDAGNLSYDYMISCKKDLNKIVDSLQIAEGGKTLHENIWQFTLDSNQLDHFEKLESVSKIERIKVSEKETNENLFSPKNKDWNIAFYGKIQIPQKDDTIYINEENIPLYERIISIYEGHHLSVSPDGHIYIDKLESTYFLPEMNYYFVLGDNRYNSSDSRFWGFVPEDHVQGKVSTVLYSIKSTGKTAGNINWNRFFKSL